MVRPKKEVTLTSVERTSNWRKRNENDYLHYKNLQNAKRSEKKKEMTEEQLELQRLAARERKQKSRMTQKANISHQKLSGLKLIDRKRKKKAREYAKTSMTDQTNTSTERVKNIES